MAQSLCTVVCFSLCASPGFEHEQPSSDVCALDHAIRVFGHAREGVERVPVLSHSRFGKVPLSVHAGLARVFIVSTQN